MKNRLVEYDEILSNCGARTVYDNCLFKSQIELHDNWRDIILKRHHRFIYAYINSNYNIKKTKSIINYPIKDLEAIFLRIQSQFEIYESDNTVVFKDMCLNIYNQSVLSNNIFKKKEEVEMFEGLDIEDDIPEDIKILSNIIEEIEKYNNSIGADKKINRQERISEIVRILAKIDDVGRYEKIFPKTVYDCINLLIDSIGVKLIDIDLIAKKMKKNTNYVFQIILGKKNPRCISEKGILLTLKDYVEKELD